MAFPGFPPPSSDGWPRPADEMNLHEYSPFDAPFSYLSDRSTSADRTDDDDEEDEVEEEDEEGDFDIEGGDPVSETGVDPAGDEEGAENEEEAQEGEEPPFDASAIGLKEISNLASFTVSSYKPGCGVKELRDDDVNQFWQYVTLRGPTRYLDLADVNAQIRRPSTTSPEHPFYQAR